MKFIDQKLLTWFTSILIKTKSLAMAKVPSAKRLLPDQNPRDFTRKQAKDRMTREDWREKHEVFEQDLAIIIDKATDDIAAILGAGDKFLVDLRIGVWMCFAVLCVIAWRVW